jgi:arylsulfatase A-like enzyme
MNKGVWHEESVRVPFLVRRPGAPAGSVVPTPISAGVDVWPTLLDWIGAEPDPGLPGRSILPMVDAGRGAEHHPVFSEMAGADGWVMVRDDDWKYVARHDDDRPVALHHLGDDPYEQENRVGHEPEQVARLAHLIGEWKAGTGIS